MLFRTRVWLLPVSAATVFLLGMAVSYVVGERAYAILQHIQESDTPYLERIAEIDGSIEKFRILLQAAAAEGDATSLKRVEPILTATRQALQAITPLPGKKEAAQNLNAAFEAYQEVTINATKALLGSGPSSGDASELVSKMQTARKALDALMQKYKAQARQDLVNGQEEVFTDLKRNQLINILTGAAVLAVLGLSSKLVLKSVWRELGDEPAFLRARVQRVAEGDLIVPVSGAPSDSASLNAAVSAMASTLCNTVEQIRATTDAIALASKEIAQGNLDLSQRTEQTASNLQKTTSSMDQLTEAVKQSADAARQAQTMVLATSDAAEHGGLIVSQVVDNMDNIQQASKKINDITSVIDSIAFQTNILALNAAVEAARAGEQGKGFAVVASEVRSLAKRSAEAAREIKTLINAAGEQVGSGTQLVREAGSAMGEIVSGVKRVTDIIDEISRSTTDQSGTISEVNRAVIELDKMTQQNAALVEQSAAAADQLKNQTIDLTHAVAAFRTS